MITVTPTFLDAVRQPQLLATEVTAIPPTGEPVVLDVSGGAVTIDRQADHRRQLTLELADHRLYPTSTTSPLNVYGTELTVRRGVSYGNGLEELVQLGVFRVEDISRSLPGGGLSVSAWDRSRQVFDRRFLQPRRFNAQLAVTLIQLLVSEVYPSVTFEVATSDATTIRKHVVERDRWAEVQRVAKLIGCEAYFTATGSFRIQDVPDLSTAVSVWDVDAGENGVLVSTQDTVTREGAPNIVVAIGESKDGTSTPVISANPHGWDTDPQSPTYTEGAYGRVPRFYSSTAISTQTQANRVADSMLQDHLGVTRTISFAAVPNPALEAGDVVTVRYPSGVRERHIIDQVVIPLSTSDAMTSETRALDWQSE